MASEITDNADEARVEIRADGELAGFVTYKRRSGRISFIHTEIDSAFEGRGLASELIRSVLDDAREEGLDVIPICPFVSGYIGKHPEYLDLVPTEAREAAGL